MHRVDGRGALLAFKWMLQTTRSTLLSVKAPCVPSDSLGVLSEDGVFLAGERPTGFEDAKILVEFRMCLRGKEHHGYSRLLEDKPVPNRGPGNQKPGWVVWGRT
jgi:hypothetical protein